MLDAVVGAITVEAGELIERQIAATVLVQRSFEDSDVYWYPFRQSPGTHDSSIALPNRAAELKLARVGLRGPSATGNAVVAGSAGHLFELLFRPAPKRLGPRSAIEVTKVTILADPMLPDAGDPAEARLADLDPDLRAELETLWASGSADALAVLGRNELYTVNLPDAECLMLGQLDDATVLVAAIDPRRPGVRRYEPDGEVIGEYRTMADALADARGRTSG